MRHLGHRWRDNGGQRAFDHRPRLNEQIPIAQIGFNLRIGTQLQHTRRPDSALNVPQYGHSITHQMALQRTFGLDRTEPWLTSKITH